MKGKLLTALYLASCVASVNVYATDTNPSWYVLPQVGVMAPDETTMGIFAALKMGKQMTDNIDVQIGVSRGVAKDEAAGYLNSKYSQDALTVEGLYFLSRDTWRPFVQAGIGYGRDKFTAEGMPIFAQQTGQSSLYQNRDESSSSVLGSFGLGLQYAQTPNRFLQLDARYLLSDSNTDKSNLYIALGVAFNLEAAPVKALPVVVPEPVVEAPAPVVVPEPVVEAPAPVVVPEPVVVAKKPQVTLHNLKSDNLFAKGSSQLTPRASKDLANALVAANIDVTKLSKVTVIGHADRTGNAAINQKISERRAEAVKVLLVGKGVSATIIQTIGRGTTESVTTIKDFLNTLKGNKVASCLAPDRRIVITAE